MRRIKLNVNELQEYDAKVINKVMYLTPGVYYFRDFFTSGISCARFGRKLYEDVRDNRFSNITLRGKYAKEGYLVS